MAVNVVLKSVFDDAGIKNAQASFGKIGKMLDRSFMAIGATVAAAGVAVVAFGKQSVNAASDLEESTNAVRVAFGDASEAILKIGQTSSKSLGVARTQFNQAAVRFSAFAERVVGQGGDVSTFVRDISQRASDFASVFNIEVSEALQVFQSGLAGEAEPLKRFGINLLDSEVKAYALANGIVSVGEQMTETQKVQARYGLLMQSTSKTAGDFANTSDGLANSQRILSATFTDLQAQIGSALLPTITQLVQQVAQFLLPKMQELGTWLKSPAGQQAVADFGIRVTELLDAMFDLFEYLKNNFDSITRFSAALLSTGVVIRGVIGAIQLMTAAQLALNVAVKANPYVLAVTALLALVSATVAFSGSTEGARLSAQKQSKQVEILSGEIADLNRSFELGAIDQETYDAQLGVLERTLNDVKLSTNSTAGELQRLNDLRLQNAIDEMNRFKLATEFATRQAESFRDSYSYLESIGAVTRKAGTASTSLLTGGGGGGGAKTEATDYVKQFFDGLSDEIAKQQAKLKLSGLGLSEGLVESIIGSGGEWEQVFDEVVKGGTAAAKKLQRQWNQTSSGIAEVAKATAEATKQLEEAEARREATILGIAQNNFAVLQERYEKFRQLLNTFTSSSNQAFNTFRDTMFPVEALGEFEGAVFSLTSALRRLTEEQLELFSPENRNAILRYVTEAEAAMRAVAFVRDELAAEITRERDKLDQQVKSRESFFQTVYNSILGSVDISKFQGSASSIIRQLRKAVQESADFQRQLQDLRGLGLTDQAIGQIEKSGVAAGSATAKALLRGGASAVSEVNELYAQLGDVAKTAAEIQSQTLFDSGIALSEGLIDGLVSQADQMRVAAEFMAGVFETTFKDTIARGAIQFTEPSYAAIEQDIRNLFDFIDELPALKPGQTRSIDWSQLQPGSMFEGVTVPQGTGVQELGRPTSGGVTITVNAGFGADGTQIGAAIVDAIARYESRNGKVFARA